MGVMGTVEETGMVSEWPLPSDGMLPFPDGVRERPSMHT